MLQKTLSRLTIKKERNFQCQITSKHILTLFSPKILLQLFVYSMSFALLLIGLKSYHLEKQLDNAVQNAQKITTFQYQKDAVKTDLSTKHSSDIQKDIAKNVIRLHVIANSDTAADQRLKLAVRDEIITSLQQSLKNADSVAQAGEIIARRQSQIQAEARKVIAAYNYNYSVQVSLSPRYFPVKQYGDLTFPAGTYQALCVDIGTAKGHNWWCVLFPSLCFVDETTAVVPDESKEKLKENLSEDAYESLSKATPAPDEQKPELRSGILDWFVNSDK